MSKTRYNHYNYLHHRRPRTTTITNTVANERHHYLRVVSQAAPTPLAPAAAAPPSKTSRTKRRRRDLPKSRHHVPPLYPFNLSRSTPHHPTVGFVFLPAPFARATTTLSVFPSRDVTGMESGIDPERPSRQRILLNVATHRTENIPPTHDLSSAFPLSSVTVSIHGVPSVSRGMRGHASRGVARARQILEY